MNGSRHVEHDGSCATLVAGIAEGALGVGVFECRDMIDRTASSTRGEASEAFCTRKSQLLGMEQRKRKEGNDKCKTKKNFPFHNNGIGLL